MTKELWFYLQVGEEIFSSSEHSDWLWGPLF